MYIPPYYKESDETKIIEFIQAHNFANLISIANNVPIATHLPFLIENQNNKWYLVSHMAKANPQWQTFCNNEVLVIFNGPHGYISPKNYEKLQNVPTWNYIAVHVYGKVKIIDNVQAVVNIMERTIDLFEKEFYAQWKNLSSDYVNGMLKAIVAFEIEITKMEGKFKLSQNKTKKEQENIIHTLEKTNDTEKIQLANEMKKLLK